MVYNDPLLIGILYVTSTFLTEFLLVWFVSVVECVSVSASVLPFWYVWLLPSFLFLLFKHLNLILINCILLAEDKSFLESQCVE